MSMNGDASPQRRSVLTNETLLPLSFLLLIAGGVLAFSGYLNNRFDSLSRDINSVDKKVDKVQDAVRALEGKVTERWTTNDMEAWTLRLARDNPVLKIPDIHK